MKTNKNLLVTRDGQARFYAKRRARAKWKNPAVPEMDRNFLVRFSSGRESWVMRAEDYPVIGGISKGLKEWAALVLQARAHLIREGEKDKLREIFTPARAVMLDEVLRVYLSNVPPGKLDYRKNALRIAAFAQETHGLDAARIEVSERFFNRSSCLAWVRMRQEYKRRGWSVRGAAPADAWEILRADLKAGLLPGIDKTTICAGNTTIQSYLRCAKAVLGETARGEYLGGLKLPELREFLAFAIALEAPKGHREIPADVYARMWNESAALKRDDVKVWCFFMLLAYSGARSISLRRMTEDALQVNEDGSGVLLVQVTKRGKPAKRLLPAEVVETLREVMMPGSLIGAASGSEARKIYLRCNAWLKNCGVEDQQKSNLLRHMNAQLLDDKGGAEMVMAGLGHTSTAMGRRYAENRRIIPMVDPRPDARKAG